eukprot:GHVP01052119.1.p1 GENE.GHVP01052119.1~~GHVP01052119.1.p1  ORF type:complete len:457 (+),score=62.87 GHVP01052119.1:219-1589(+)
MDGLLAWIVSSSNSENGTLDQSILRFLSKCNSVLYLSFAQNVPNDSNAAFNGTVSLLDKLLKESDVSDKQGQLKKHTFMKKGWIRLECSLAVSLALLPPDDVLLLLESQPLNGNLLQNCHLMFVRIQKIWETVDSLTSTILASDLTNFKDSIVNKIFVIFVRLMNSGNYLFSKLRPFCKIAESLELPDQAKIFASSGVGILEKMADRISHSEPDSYWIIRDMVKAFTCFIQDQKNILNQESAFRLKDSFLISRFRLRKLLSFRCLQDPEVQENLEACILEIIELPLWLYALPSIETFFVSDLFREIESPKSRRSHLCRNSRLQELTFSLKIVSKKPSILLKHKNEIDIYKSCFEGKKDILDPLSPLFDPIIYEKVGITLTAQWYSVVAMSQEPTKLKFEFIDQIIDQIDLYLNYSFKAPLSCSIVRLSIAIVSSLGTVDQLLCVVENENFLCRICQ